MDSISKMFVVSNHSDDINSVVSTLSSSSYYQDEFEELQHSIHSQNSPNNDSGCHMHHEEEFNDPHHLQSSLKSSEQDNHFVQFQQKNHNLILENSILRSKLSQVKSEKDELELQIKQFSIERNHTKIDLEMKNAVLKELKDKISHQYSEINKINQNNYTTVQKLNEKTLEIQHLKKSEEWYKQQLRSSQINKQRLLNELADCKSKISSLNGTIANLDIEIGKVKNMSESCQFNALKEKQDLLEQLKNNECYAISENEQLRTTTEIPSDNTLMNKHHEEHIQDLQNEFSRLNAFIEIQNESFKKITTENSDLLSRIVILQKALEEKEFIIDKLKIENGHSKSELTLCMDREREMNEKFRNMKEELVDLKTELHLSKQENEVVGKTVETIRNQFSVFQIKYHNLKEDISVKNKKISCLQSEKQELFMKNSWQICELERIKDKDVLISTLKNEIKVKEQEIGRYCTQIEVFRSEMKKQANSVSNLSDEKDIIKLEHGMEIQRYQNVLQQYKDLLISADEKIANLQKQHNIGTIFTDLDEIKLLKTKLDEIKSNSSTYDICKNLDDDSKSFISKLPESMNSVKLENITPVSENDERKSNNLLSSKAENVKRNIDIKLRDIIKKTEKLLNKTEECEKLLNHVQPADFEETNQMRVLLGVKNLEIQGMQKKYETNYRTLLRKVKEHMKSENLYEKRNEQLRELCNRLRNENETLKLSFVNREKLKQPVLDQELKSAGMEFHSEKSNNLEQVNLIEKENEILRLGLQIHLKCRQDEIAGNETKWKKLTKETHDNNNRDELKTYLHELQNEIQSLNSEKFFFQRLSSDLKLALKSHSNYNKVLEDKIRYLSQKSQHCSSSLTTIFPESHDFNKHDEHVNHLLQNNSSVQKIQLTELCGSLDILKKDFLTLQEQINRKFHT